VRCTCELAARSWPPHAALRLLFGNAIGGTIPPSLGSLTNLSELCVRAAAAPEQQLLTPGRPRLRSLYSNSLTGSIPASIGDLTSLTNLCVLHKKNCNPRR